MGAAGDAPPTRDLRPPPRSSSRGRRFTIAACLAIAGMSALAIMIWRVVLGPTAPPPPSCRCIDCGLVALCPTDQVEWPARCDCLSSTMGSLCPAPAAADATCDLAGFHGKRGEPCRGYPSIAAPSLVIGVLDSCSIRCMRLDAYHGRDGDSCAGFNRGADWIDSGNLQCSR